MDISSLVTDLEKEVEGVWCPLGDGEIKVAREGNEAYIDFLHGIVQANRAALDQNDKTSRDLQRKLLIRAYAHTILKDLRNIKFKGEVIEKYTPEKGMELLSIKDFFTKVEGYAKSFELFQRKAEENLVKN